MLSEAFCSTPNIASPQFAEYFQLGSRRNIGPIKNGLKRCGRLQKKRLISSELFVTNLLPFEYQRKVVNILWQWLQEGYRKPVLGVYQKKLTWCVASTETIRLISDWKKEEGGVWRWGKREITYLTLHCHHQNDSCITMGSDESHCNVSLIVREKVTRQCPQTTSFFKRKESRGGFEPRSFC